jgi:hypothetical protein
MSMKPTKKASTKRPVAMMTRSSHERICRDHVGKAAQFARERDDVRRTLDLLLGAMEVARIAGYVNPGVLDYAYAAAGRKQPGK